MGSRRGSPTRLHDFFMAVGGNPNLQKSQPRINHVLDTAWRPVAAAVAGTFDTFGEAESFQVLRILLSY